MVMLNGENALQTLGGEARIWRFEILIMPNARQQIKLNVSRRKNNSPESKDQKRLLLFGLLDILRNISFGNDLGK